MSFSHNMHILLKEKLIFVQNFHPQSPSSSGVPNGALLWSKDMVVIARDTFLNIWNVSCSKHMLSVELNLITFFLESRKFRVKQRSKLHFSAHTVHTTNRAENVQVSVPRHARVMLCKLSRYIFYWVAKWSYIICVIHCTDQMTRILLASIQ